MGKRRYISFKVEDDIGDAAAYGPVREPWRVRCGRCMRFTGFCLVCTGTLFQALAPWMLSAIEVVGLLVMLLLLVHHPPGPYEFHFNSSLEDVVLLGGLRAAALSGTYAWGSSSNRLTPYLVTSYVVGVVGFAYALVKAYSFMYPLAWIPPAALMATFALFSCMHILAARHTVAWARRRGQLGLAPFEALGTLRYSSSAGSLVGLADGTTTTAAAGSPSTQWLINEDVPAELLADVDSQFIDIGGLVVHYKEARPPHHSWLPAADAQPASQQQQQASTSTAAVAGLNSDSSNQTATAHGAAGSCSAGVIDAVVLVHGFGGGVFSWRHVMAPLAAAAGVPVVALDRPGFGLTARPMVFEDTVTKTQSDRQQQLNQPLMDLEQQQQQQEIQLEASQNPYTIEAQASLVLQLCAALGHRRVLLVGHADGCLVVLHAAAAAAAAAARNKQAAGSAGAAAVMGQTGRGSSSYTSAVSSSYTSAVSSSEHAQPKQQQHHASGVPSGSSPSPPDLDTAGTSPTSSISLSSMLAATNNSGQHHQQQQQQAEHPAGSSSVMLRPPEHIAAVCRGTDNTGQQDISRMAGHQPGTNSPASSCPQAGVTSSSCVSVCGLVLCAPHLSGHHIQPFTRLLAASSLGRNITRPLLRSQVGDVRSRGSWYEPELITPKVLQLYRAPLHVEGWDTALLASSKATASISSRQVEQQLHVIRHMPVLIVTGEADRIVPASKMSAVTSLLRNSQSAVVPECGHLLHEEAPAELVQLLRAFSGRLRQLLGPSTGV